MTRPEALMAPWMDHWSDALALWSRFTRLRPPLLCTTAEQAREEGLTGSFAMIRLADQSVVVDLSQVIALGLQDEPLAVLGHEIGHHIAAPASLLVNGKAIARMRVALPGVEHHAPRLANMYADLLINDRLRREHDLRIERLYQAIERAVAQPGQPSSASPLWAMYLRTYEILWALPHGSVTSADREVLRIEGDAQLCARLVRSYAGQWVDGAGRFAALCFAYLEGGEAAALAPASPWADTERAGEGARIPPGLSDIDPDEAAGAIHPAMDPELNGLGAAEDDAAADVRAAGAGQGASAAAGQRREPFEYGQILRALGLDLTEHEIAVRYYREQAVPHLVGFPSIPQPVAGETLPEGFRPWSIGEPLEMVDWGQSIYTSPVVIPGVTTVTRVHGVDDTRPPEPVPLDLDLYVDSSGSMPNPQRQLSYPALAATVIALSALRAGARVQATLWSGAAQFLTTDGFTDQRDDILRVILGHIGGGTAFPLHVLRDTYAARTPEDPPAHILVISDNGVTTIFADDEQGTPGREIQQAALAAARGGGTWALQLFGAPDLREAEDLGWRIEPVTDLDELIAFARRFARMTYTEVVGRA